MKITFSRYKRLLLVLSIPLLLAGAVFSYHSSPHKTTQAILCFNPHIEEKNLVGRESCLFFSEFASDFYQSIRSTQPLWFDTRLSRESKLLTIVASSSSRLITEATITGGTPFDFSSPESKEYINYLTGKTGDIIVGIYGRGDGSAFYRDGGFVLYCSSLIYKDEADTYLSSCYGDGWDGEIEYVVSGQSKEMLSNLEQAISSRIRKADASLIMHWVARTPAFLLLFIVVSLIPYILLKSYNYVKSG